MNEIQLALAIAGVLATIAAFVSAHATYRLARRRVVKVVEFKTALVRPGLGAADLEIKLRGSDHEVRDPVSLRLDLVAQAPNDVPVEAFGDRPLRIAVGAPVVSLIAIDGHPDSAAIVAEWRSTFSDHVSPEAREPWPESIDLPPALLSIRQPWSVVALCDGNPSPVVSVQLANVDFLTPSEALARDRKRFTAGLASTLALAFITALLVYATENSTDDAASAGLMVFVGVFLVLIFSRAIPVVVSRDDA